ncbi:MAG: prepilin-type N-terminal cleavage/methylation domain-containing protein [Deltaproteobacteria bacterium]|nr:prepilin-type N-terminal cleavage/methylation domain-containing protein [Deltaproteobacteria bacterium]
MMGTRAHMDCCGIAHGRARGLTLIEVLVSVGVLAMVSVLVYGAAYGLTRSKESVGHINERYREGRAAIHRMNNELSAAYISMHQPINPMLSVRNTAMVGTNGSPADRVDFTSFSHLRITRDSHESDQCELSYFGSPDPEVSGKTDLARRESLVIDLEPRKGGRVNVMAENIDLFDVKYLDPMSGMWQETWDSTQASGQYMRMPLQLKVSLVLRDGPGGRNIPFVARIAVAMHDPLAFAIPRP